MKKSILYLITFAAVQALVTLAAMVALRLWFPDVSAESPAALIAISIATDILLLAVFLGCKWYRANRDYIMSRPWAAMAWTALLGIGIIFPLTLLEEQIPESWRIDLVGDELLEMLKTTEGYFAVCMLAPLTEEVAFRGAMISALQKWAQGRTLSPAAKTWLPIVISALFFAGIHMNPAQMPHALIMGMLLGWLFTRTGSILPCFLIHWINNSAAFVAVKLFPNLPMNANLADYFNGNTTAVWQAVICSLMIALPSLYQLNRILRRKNLS